MGEVEKLVVEEQWESMTLLGPHMSVASRSTRQVAGPGGRVDVWTVDDLEHNLNVVQMEYKLAYLYIELRR